MATVFTGPIIGIDLGTTYSSVAIYRNNNAEIIPNHIGKYSTPSIYAVTTTERKVGTDAQKHGMKNPLETLFDSKRMIGLPFSHHEIQSLINEWPFTIIDENGKPVYSIDRGESTQTFTPVEVSSFILAYLKEQAEIFLGRTITRAVITCPAYFSENQKQATIEAAELAGLHVEHLLTEPTAAALAYGISANHTNVHYLMVFDFGGGTLDISILHLNGNRFTAVATHGDNHCGGRDIDNALTRFLAEKFQEQSGEDIRGNPRALAKLRSAAEDAKIALSSSVIASIDLQYLVTDIDFTYDIKRTDFELLCEETFQHCISCAQSALIDAGLTANDLDKILLVGGSSRIPRIQELLKEAFGDKLSHEIHPDEAVAKGAAIQASLLDADSIPEPSPIELATPLTSKSSLPNIELVEIIPYDLGVLIKDGSIPPVIYRNSPFGTIGRQTYQNATANNSTAHINIFEVPLPMEGSPKRLGTVELAMEPGSVGSTLIDVTFEYDKNGILTVKAKNRNTNKIETLKIKR